MFNDKSIQSITDASHLVLSVIPFPKDTNPGGIVFGGWTLAQFDVAGSVIARREARKQNMSLVTKAVNHMEFILPIYVGDRVSFYAQLASQGSTSYVVDMVATAERYSGEGVELVAKAAYVYVQIRPRN
ncbi:acyl-CoA thioesterase [Ostreibacterium oceani]|uniref:Acyl-CoA thioesterase n=1 Tax=Ostreibacterium oceani TaxID=2654998 RepID=A0A6N7EZL8_9GAMM|nr:hotdog domain-containing protein [Ostreibacterium oceani]MPV86809.1 acyl-CoA thioesterase [Ostreibacterium oceani]